MLHIRLALILGIGVLATLLQGCAKEGCLSGEEGCRVESPCTALTFSCDEPGELVVKTLAAGDTFPGGMDALGSVGDILIGNGHVQAVIAQIGNQNGLDPNGGAIIDLAITGRDNDGLNVVPLSTGLLPRDVARYTSLELIDERPTRVAVQAKGHLDGRPEMPVYTLYEVRPCDRGVRIRTEVVNGSRDAQTWVVADVFYWQDRAQVSFSPAENLGFNHPAFSLTGANDAWRAFPFIAGASHEAPYASYALTACNVPTMEGLNNDFVSAGGIPRTLVQPRDYRIFERFLGVEDGDDVAAAVDTALEIRRQLFEEDFVTITGRVERVGAVRLDTPRETNVLLFEGDLAMPRTQRIPWSQVVPDANGVFTARVPKGRRFLVEVHSFGTLKVEKELGTLEADTDVGAFSLPATAKVTFNVNDGPGANPVSAIVYVFPADGQTETDTRGSLHDHEWVSNKSGCAPWLGPEWGSSPSCNRILVTNGTASAEVPMGTYHFYAFKGPFWTIERKTQTLGDGDYTLDFSLQALPLQPEGTLGADLHVHSGVSFDSSLPQRDRVLSFDALDLDVIVASEHDIAWDFTETIRALGLDQRMTSVSGVETTAQIPFLSVPGDGFPRVIGHYIFWPLSVDLDLPRNGGPYDDMIEPGVLFDRVQPLYSAEEGVIQLPHPWGGPYFGRDTGWPRAVHLDLLRDLPDGDDGTNAGLYVRSPQGGLANDAHDAQEVMNGSNNDSLLEYRSVWHYTLNQGKLKAGTANSDSHSLTDNTVGVPRSIIQTSTPAGPGFDVNAFNRAVKEGKLLGTNGPVIEATVRGSTGSAFEYGLQPFTPPADATVHLKLSAAPWVPVKEIRFIVNGKVTKTIDASQLASPENPFGTDGLVRFEGQVPLGEILEGVRGDAWVVIEAGDPLPLAADFGGGLPTAAFPDGAPDGVPDTGDNNGDGRVDEADIEAGEAWGPLVRPPAPKEERHPNIHFSRVVTEAYPFAFTNPFVLDRDGNGRFDAPGVEGR